MTVAKTFAFSKTVMYAVPLCDGGAVVPMGAAVRYVVCAVARGGVSP